MDIHTITEELHTLEGEIHFPISKQELVTLAESKPISDEAKKLLHGLPEQDFHSMDEIVQKVPFGQTIENDMKGALDKIV